MKYKVLKEYVSPDKLEAYIEVQADDHPVPMQVCITKWTLVREGVMFLGGSSYWRQRATVELYGKVLECTSNDPKLFKIYREFCIKHGYCIDRHGKFIGDK